MNMQFNNRFLATLIVMGQLELRDIINAMPQFKQRFAIFYVLKHLDEIETARYVRHRLQIAGAEKCVFTDEASALMYDSSGGRPRQINNICDMSLLVGCMRNVNEIDGGIVREVINDLGEKI